MTGFFLPKAIPVQSQFKLLVQAKLLVVLERFNIFVCCFSPGFPTKKTKIRLVMSSGYLGTQMLKLW
jgi:hypothetical protein